MKTWLILMASLTLTACSTFSKANEQNLYQVHVGESKTELLAALGDPQSRTVTGSNEKWFYNIWADDNRKTYPYTATFENDHLVKWDFDTARNMEPDPSQRANRRAPSSAQRPF